MTSCLVVNEKTVIVSSIDVDKCYVCSLDDGNVKNLTECLGEAYNNIPFNNRDLQKACAAFSIDGKLFAYNTNKGKLLSIWNTTDWSLVENKTLAKHATNIIYTPKTNVIIVGDKKGDVYKFDQSPVRVLGHSSMILNICFTKDEKYIVTCDSDEKVRVSHYPNGKNILYYMMGHEAYVSGVCMLNNFILSGSGDCTVRLWDYDDGRLLDKLPLHTAIQTVVEIDDLAAIQLYNSNEICIIRLEMNDSKWSIKIIKTIKFDDIVLDLAVYNDQLWVITSHSIDKYIIDSTSENIVKNENLEISKTIQTLNNLIKSFLYSENINLITFFIQKDD